MKCVVYELGMLDYTEGHALQQRFCGLRIENAVPDILLLLEHPPTITVGKTGHMDNILVPAEQLEKEGIALSFPGRGGDVTYHGPGQLVAYPILSLRQRKMDVHAYVRSLEEVVIRTVRDFNIVAERDPSHPGVWVDGAELAAIGLRIRKWVTMHGVALNVNTDMRYFSLIHPCGLANRKAVSMADILGFRVLFSEVKQRFIAHFQDTFKSLIEYGTEPPG
jgi:lipoate-protein ligase B